MSETLITLVIIGIIAAVTIPVISRSSEKYILRNQFKKTYSTILNAMNKADTDLGGNTLCYYKLKNNTITNGDFSECRVFFEQMFKNLSVQKVCTGNAKTDGCIPSPYMKNYITYNGVPGFFQEEIENNNKVYNLADGTIAICYGLCSVPLFIVDVNGAKGPNEFGKDIFTFLIVRNDDEGLKMYKVINGYMPAKYFTYLSDIFKE